MESTKHTTTVGRPWEDERRSQAPPIHISTTWVGLVAPGKAYHDIRYQ